jgi:hypothetical protein
MQNSPAKIVAPQEIVTMRIVYFSVTTSWFSVPVNLNGFL